MSWLPVLKTTKTLKTLPNADELRATVRLRCQDLLDDWSKIVDTYRETGTATQYQREVGEAKQLLYEFLSPDLEGLHERHFKFRANRSMRDVEPEVNLWLKNLDGKSTGGS